MSGGVDSSVAAAMLKEKGYEIIGVTMQVWPQDAPLPQGESGCCSLSAVNDARRVADILEIPHYVMNFRDEFEEKVIADFIANYMGGRTPNPCIVCNKEIKFKSLLSKARALEADYVATGHYARIDYDTDRGRYLLRKGIDRGKDQSYVLYNLTQEQLGRTLFPLGPFTKDEIRSEADRLGLPVASKPESQEICFIPDDDYRRFIKERVGSKIKPGNFVDREGKVIGRHRGYSNYTIGQRKGLGLALGYPAYVVGIDVEKNTVIIGTEEDIFHRELVVEDNNYIAFERLEGPLQALVKIRYKAEEAPAEIAPLEGGRVKVKFDEPQRAITPGQSAVYYEKDVVLGGGIISS